MPSEVAACRDQAEGHVDLIANGVVAGWAVSAASSGPALLFVFIDGAPVGNAICDTDRPDLALVGLCPSKAGFFWKIPAEFLDGQPHTIAIRFSDGTHLKCTGKLGGGHVNSATFQFDPPPLVKGVVDGLENGAIRGWAICTDLATGKRLGGLNLIVLCEGEEIGRVAADKYRLDVAKSLSCDAHCGFAFVPPVRFRDGGRFAFQFKVAPYNVELGNSPYHFEFPSRATTTKLAQLVGAIETMSTQLWRLKRDLNLMLNTRVYTLDDYDSWAREYQKALSVSCNRLRQKDAKVGPLVSIICPVYRPNLQDFKSAVESVIRQTYCNWELILVDDASDSCELTELIDQFVKTDRRIKSMSRPDNGGISAATNAALAAAQGQYVAFFDHDDMLVELALEVMVGEAQDTGAKLLYSDEDKIDDYGRFSEPNFKPDWNYRLLLCHNYVCHFLMVEGDTLRKVGPLDTKYDGAQDHDLVLRLAEVLGETDIRHVPEVLYHWRKTPGSTAITIGAKSYAIRAGTSAVRDHLRRRSCGAKVSAVHGGHVYRVNWTFREEPKVCVIIPFREQVEITRKCLDHVRENTAYKNVEVLLVDNWSTSTASVQFCAEATGCDRTRVLHVREPFNFSRINNLASQETDAEFLLFINNDVFVSQRDWLRRLVNEALADATVGAVGAKLAYPDGTLQHGGVILGAGGVGNHAHSGVKTTAPGYMARAICSQELSAVTAALMLCRASAFREVGGFDEEALAVAYNDVDLCLKLRRSGYRVLWTPDVLAEHHESLSRGDDMQPSFLARFVFEERAMLSRWPDEIARDPFYNKNFSSSGGLFEELSCEPLRTDGERRGQ